MQKFFAALLASTLTAATTAPASAQLGFNDHLEPAAAYTWAADEVGWFVSSSADFWLNTIRTRFGDGGSDRDVTVELRTAPGNQGGTVLRSAVFNSSIARTALGGGVFADFLMVANTSYFIGFRNVGGLGVNFATGSGLAPDTYYADWSADGSYDYDSYSGGTRGAILQLDHSAATVTPEPVSMALLGTGLAGLGAVRRRRRKEAETA